MVEDLSQYTQYTEDELRELAKIAVESEEKGNTFTFLTNVARASDTTKLGNLKTEEVGIPMLSARTLKELELYCREIYEDPDWADFFKKRSEILTSTSLSKDAKLIDLAVLRRTETTRTDKFSQEEIKQNKGWFKKKTPEPQM